MSKKTRLLSNVYKEFVKPDKEMIDGLRSMIGKTFTSIHRVPDSEIEAIFPEDGYTDYEEYDLLVFTDTYGLKYHFKHIQDCCEEVYIEDIVGDLNDLIGSPMIVAEESYQILVDDYNDPLQNRERWTFYKFATIKGYVDVRFVGGSRSYAEKVYLEIK